MLNTIALRPVILALDSPDYILTFFATIIIGLLYDFGAIDRLEWEPNGPLSKRLSKTINHIQSGKNSAKQFHSYICEERENLANVCGRTRLDGTLPICYFIGLDEEHVKGPSQNPALLLFDADGIDLIKPRGDVSGLKIDYVTIRLSRHTRTRCIFPNENGGQKGHISLHIHADDIIEVNDRKKGQKVIQLSITSRDDMAKVRKGFEAIGIRCQTDIRTSQSNRRSSSIVIPLGTDDEVYFKSFQPSQAPSQTVMDSTPHHVRWMDESANPIDRPDYVVDNAPVDSPQSSLTEFTRTPTFRGTSSPRVRESSHSQRNSPEFFAKRQCMGKGQHVPNTATKSASSEELTDISPENRQAREKRTSQNEKDVSESGPARNTRSKSSLGEKSVCKNTVLKPIPPNTQESLIFPRRRSRGKLYTAPTKTKVDWDEDLRESDRSVEPETRKDSGLTSVSSALSSGIGCVFNKSLKPCSALSIRRKSATKPKKRAKTGSKRKERRLVKRRAKLPLSSPKIVQDDPRPGDSRAFVLDGNNMGNRNRACKEGGTANDPSPPPRSTDGTSYHSTSQGSDTRCGESTMETTFEGDQRSGWDNQGRGQTVAEKLIAALRGSSTPEKQFGNTEHRPEAVHEPSEPLNDILHGTLDAKHKERSGGMQDMPGSQESNVCRNGAAGDEVYSIETCSVDSPDGNRNSPLQNDEADKGWILREGKSIFETESEDYIERAIWISSPAASSSGKPRSRESSFEFYFTGAPPKPHCTIPVHSEKAASPNLFKQISCVPEETSKTVTTTAGDGAAFSATDALRGLTKNGPDHVAKRLDSSSKPIVDNNGSPRFMQREKKEHITPKRWSPLLVQQQPTVKKMKTTHQGGDKNVTFYEMEWNQSKNDDSPTTDSSPITTYADSDIRSKKDTPGTFEQAIKGSGKGHSAVFPTGTGRNSSLKDLKRASPGLPKNGGQHGSSENREYSLKPPSITAGKLPLERNNSERKVAYQQSEDAACEIDWQTSLQELHRSMELTLINNNKVSSGMTELLPGLANIVFSTYPVRLRARGPPLIEC